MKLTDKDAEWVAPLLRCSVIGELESTFNNEAGILTETRVLKDGIYTYKSKAGTFQVPKIGHVRPNKALDVLYKLAADVGLSVLQTAAALDAIHDDLTDRSIS